MKTQLPQISFCLQFYVERFKYAVWLNHSAFNEGNYEILQRIGPVLHISPSRNIIVKIERTPRIGETVVDENLRVIGKVFDILGPVSSPYAAIRPIIQKPEELTKKTLYIPSKRRKEKK
jgi:RNA-binding protein